MNPFQSLVPPNMDVVCSVQYGYDAITTTQLDNTTSTCSNPWNYYEGYGFDIVTVVLTITVVCMVLIGYKKH